MAREIKTQSRLADELISQSPPVSSSYVYPVRSLLSGRIQPAADRQAQASVPRASSLSSSDTSSVTTAVRSNRPIGGEDASQVLDVARAGRNSELTEFQDNDSVYLQRPGDGRAELVSRKGGHSSKRSEDVRVSPNFIHYPAGDEPCLSRTFATNPATSSLSCSSDVYGRTFAPGPTGELVPVALPGPCDEVDELDCKHITQVSQLAGDAFSTIPPVPPEQIPFNPSQYGLVHLPPLPCKDYNSDGRSEASGPSSSRYSTASSTKNSSTFADLAPQSPTLSSSSPRSHRGLESGLEPQVQSIFSGSSASRSCWEPIVTMRYQHKEDENGHHIVVGREGQLTCCQDEPIRTPGAVQGFGVLIAVHENIENGNLSVRQVSENSTELLGLSPKYLFSLECFTETLPDTQADILWDNIQYLQEPDFEQEEGPHVFTLVGLGEKGSAISGEPSDQGRRVWTCWCAVHRPQCLQGDSGETSGMIILEFELEKDTRNPLYPISSHGPSNTSSPSGNSFSSNATKYSSRNGSDTTLVSSIDSAKVSSTADDKAENSSNHPSQTESCSHTMPNLSADPEDDDWIPSAEDILESTTSRSKPIPALERLRRMSRANPHISPAYSATGGSGGVRARRAAARAAATSADGVGSASGVGMMDVFAVMSQITKQLGAAPDLDTFLKIVVGIIKDLSQFHRVMVYQFDEVWNGEVLAELVDWSHSHDLFKGLHFPASDIPAQARELYALNKVRLLYDCSQPTARIVVRSKTDLETPLDMTHCYLRAMSPIHIEYLSNMGVRASMSISIMSFGSLWGLITCHSYGDHGMRVSFPVRQMLRLLSQSISRMIERLSYAQRLRTRRLINTVATDNHPTDHIVSNADDLLGLFDADCGILVIGEGAKILGPNLHGQEVLVMAEYLRLKQFETIKVSQAVVKDFPDLVLSTGLEVIAGLLYVPLSSGGKDFIAFMRKGQPRDVHWAGRPRKDSGSLVPRKSFKIWSEIVAGRCRAWTDEQMETVAVLSLVYGKFIEVWRQKETILQTTKLTNILLSNAGHEVRTPLNHIINYLEMALDGPLDIETRDNLSVSHAASKSLLFTINDLLDLTRLESGNQTSLNEAFDLQSAIEDATRIYQNEAGRRKLGFNVDVSDSPKMVIGDVKKIKTVVANLTANALQYTVKGSIAIRCHTFAEPEGLRAPKQTAVEIVVADTGCGIASDKLEDIFREFEQVESLEPKTGHTTGLGLGLAVVARIVEQLGGQLRVDSTVDKGSRFSFLIPLMLSSESHSLPPPVIPQTASIDTERLTEAFPSNHVDDATERKIASSQIQIKVHSAERSGPVMTQNASVIALPDITSDRDGQNYIKLRVLVVEDNDINRRILGKRLSLSGHAVIYTSNGQECVDKFQEDRDFDCILMDLQMPILNGFEATERIRDLEKEAFVISRSPISRHLSHNLNGRVPIFAVSASLFEHQRDELCELGMDGWILKPIDFKRLDIILKGVTDPIRRELDVYHPGCVWEIGGWLPNPPLVTSSLA